MVKICVDDDAGKLPKIPIAISTAIIQAAHRHGLKVVAHIFYLEDAKQLAGRRLGWLCPQRPPPCRG